MILGFEGLPLLILGPLVGAMLAGILSKRIVFRKGLYDKQDSITEMRAKDTSVSIGDVEYEEYDDY